MSKLFLSRISSYFPGKEKEFLDALKQKPSEGFFLNLTKGNEKELLREIDFAYEPFSLNPASYFHFADGIGHHPAYVLGLLYAQEPSASLPAALPDTAGVRLAVDLCAAPGGKSCGLMNRLPAEALLIANDINYSRAEILSSNVERMGYSNVMVTSLPPGRIAEKLAGQADLVMVDAPCSGEGMIRKDARILKEYSSASIEACALRQKGLLEEAWRLCAPGGQIVYSTCTFAPEEDEEVVCCFLKKHQDMHPVPLASFGGNESLKVSFLEGSEGQFAVLLRKEGECLPKHFPLLKEKTNEILDQYLRQTTDLSRVYCYEQNNRFFLSLHPLHDFGLSFLRYGIPAGEMRGKRFVPSHAFYRAEELKDHFRYTLELTRAQYEKYISGQEVEDAGEKRELSLRYHGYLLGYGHRSENRIKNKYPKGLRRMI